MRRIFSYLAVSALFLGVQASTKAQNILVPAGTLLRCTLDEPNFSSATVDIGDPVICHLSALRQFGKEVFPRGSYLGGHLEADKEPGHFWGKGYLKIEFDRIGFPGSDIPVPSKIIAAKGNRVNKKGDIVGKGHPTRDTVEWLIPPLWPWKILTLPAKGPRPALKGEEQITVRLDNKDTSDLSEIGYEAKNVAPTDGSGSMTNAAVTSDPPAQMVRTSSVVNGQPARVRLIALKSENVYAVTNYRINGGSLSYVLASGGKGSVDITEVDWRATSRLNAEPISSTTDSSSRGTY